MPTLCSVSVLVGCASGKRDSGKNVATTPAVLAASGDEVQRLPSVHGPAAIQQVSWEQADDAGPATQLQTVPEPIGPVRPMAAEELSQLVELAQWQNPRLRGLQGEVGAAQAKVAYIAKLPDPTIGANIFAVPIETAAGAQRANLTIMQRFPWLHRLDAQAQQACFEAQAVEQVYEAERLKVIGDVRALWYRLYVLGKQIEVNLANQELLKVLIRIANARVAAGAASQGDVLLGTLELSRLAEQMLTLNQRIESSKAELNRVVGRSSDHPVAVPEQLAVILPNWSHNQLREQAIRQQPAIAAAALRTDATQWGVEVARLKRRPDIAVSASWFEIDDDRPQPSTVDVGRDAWSIGVQANVPIWRHKYNAIEQEAVQRHLATQASVEDAINKYDALLRDLWAQAKAASDTTKLYQSTILPQAEQTLKADQESYGTGGVEFDRVIGDLRNVLTLQLEQHRAVGRLATALARIRQAAALDNDHVTPEPLPIPTEDSQPLPSP